MRTTWTRAKAGGPVAVLFVVSTLFLFCNHPLSLSDIEKKRGRGIISSVMADKTSSFSSPLFPLPQVFVSSRTRNGAGAAAGRRRRRSAWARKGRCLLVILFSSIRETVSKLQAYYYFRSLVSWSWCFLCLSPPATASELL